MTGLIAVILKGIGWMLLGLLILVLFLLCLVLFVPVRYRADGSYLGKPKGHIRVTWLLHFLCVKISYEEDGLQYNIKICGIPFRSKSGEDKTAESRKSETEKPEEAGADKSAGGQSAGDDLADDRKAEKLPEKDGAVKRPSETQTTNLSQKAERAEYTESTEDSGNTGYQEQQAEPENTGKEEKQKAGEPKRTLWQRLAQIWDRIIKKIRELAESWNKVKENINYYIEILQREESGLVLGNTFSQILRILKHIGPAKWEARLAIGTGEPDTTGQIMAVYGILYPFVGEKLVMEPDFEKKRLETDFYVKGRIQAFTLLVCVLRVVLDRKLWKFIKLMKREETAHGGKK